jgi:DNA-directed RNA polymerase specialized sigma24 family protein
VRVPRTAGRREWRTVPTVAPNENKSDQIWSLKGWPAKAANKLPMIQRRLSMMAEFEFGAIYESGFVRTVRVLRGRGASADQAEDIAQSAWLQGWRKLDQLRDSGLIIGWINTIAINFYRRIGKDDARYQELSGFEVCGSSGINSISLDVAKILKNCHPRDRNLFEQQLAGLTTQEIADRQGISPTAARLRLFRARRVVRTKCMNDLARSRDQIAP